MATFEISWGRKAGQNWDASSTRFGALGGGGHVDPQTTENRVQVRIRSSYTLANMYVRVPSNTTTADSTLRSRINGANGNLVVTVGGGLTGAFQDTTNSDSPVDGDLANFQVVTPADVLSTSLVGFTMANVSGDDTILVSNSSTMAGFTQGSDVTRYMPMGGTNAGDIDTEANVQYTLRSSATWSNFRAFVAANSIGGTVTGRTRLNTGNGAQSVSISASATGSFEDTTNSDSPVAGDEVDYQMVTPVTLGSITWNLFQVKSAGTGRQVAFGHASGISLSADRFEPIEGSGVADTSDAEASNQIAARSTFTASNLFVNVITHGASSGVDFFLRLGGANSALTLNVAASSTGLFENTTNTVDLISGNLYNHSVDHGGGAGSITFTLLGLQNGPTATLVPLIAAGYSPDIFDFLPEEPDLDFEPQGELYYWAFLLDRPGAGEPIPTQPTTPTMPTRLREPARR